MKAIKVVEGSLVWDEAVTPEIGPGLIRISNRATAINRADLAQRAGAYPPPPGASPYWVWSVLEPLRKSAMV